MQHFLSVDTFISENSPLWILKKPKESNGDFDELAFNFEIFFL